jgi:hypothetical protein
MGLECFNPQGLSQLISVTTTPSTAIQLPNPSNGVRIYAEGQIHFAFGSTSGSSGILATMATSAATANGICLPAGSVETFVIGPNAYLSFISSAAATVRFTPGNGI